MPSFARYGFTTVRSGGQDRFVVVAKTQDGHPRSRVRPSCRPRLQLIQASGVCRGSSFRGIEPISEDFPIGIDHVNGLFSSSPSQCRAPSGTTKAG